MSNMQFSKEHKIYIQLIRFLWRIGVIANEEKPKK